MEKEALILILVILGLWLGSGIAIDFGRKIAHALKISTLIACLFFMRGGKLDKLES